MAIRRLFTMLEVVAIENANQQARNNVNVGKNAAPTSDLIFKGSVISVSDIAIACSVMDANGGTKVVLAGQDTDEPLRAGQLVWMSRVRNEYVVHGSAR